MGHCQFDTTNITNTTPHKDSMMVDCLLLNHEYAALFEIFKKNHDFKWYNWFSKPRYRFKKVRFLKMYNFKEEYTFCCFSLQKTYFMSYVCLTKEPQDDLGGFLFIDIQYIDEFINFLTSVDKSDNFDTIIRRLRIHSIAKLIY